MAFLDLVGRSFKHTWKKSSGVDIACKNTSSSSSSRTRSSSSKRSDRVCSDSPRGRGPRPRNDRTGSAQILYTRRKKAVSRINAGPMNVSKRVHYDRLSLDEAMSCGFSDCWSTNKALTKTEYHYHGRSDSRNPCVLQVASFSSWIKYDIQLNRERFLDKSVQIVFPRLRHWWCQVNPCQEWSPATYSSFIATSTLCR